MAVQLSPGVQVIEKDYTETVPTLSTSTGAMAGVFKWGPVEEPTLVTSESELVSTFGAPTDANYESFFLAKNFLDYSNQMYVARVDTAPTRNAVATRSGRVSNIVLTLPGDGYTAVPDVTISAPAIADGQQATAQAVLSGGSIASYTIVSGGSGYSVGDVVKLSRPEQTFDTKDANGNVTNRQYKYAKAKVTQVNESTSAITEISFEETGADAGDGYINSGSISYSILTSNEATTSSGTGANITFGVETSSIKDIIVTNGGSGYTDAQAATIAVTITPTQQSFLGTAATAVGAIVTSGLKIKNKQDYNTNFSLGQGTYGEFAAKYPGAMGNSLAVSMCDSANWSTIVKGLFLARKNVESNEEARETTYVRRVLMDEATFDNDALDAGKILRSSNGNELGEIFKIITDQQYRFIQLSADTTYNVSINQHVRTSVYGSTIDISKIARTTAGVVTITTAADHGLKVGQFVTVQATIDQSVNAINAIVTAVPTSTTFKYQTSTYIEVVESTDAGAIQSQSMGVVDGFVKEWDEEDDVYRLSRRGFIVTVADAQDHDWTTGTTLVDSFGVEIGAIEAVKQVQTIVLKAPSKNDVYGTNDAIAEWKYKSLFNNNAPSTSAYVAKMGGTNDEVHVVVVDEEGRITGNPGTVLEQYADLSKASDARTSEGKTNYYKTILNTNSAWIWSLDHPQDVEASTEENPKVDWGNTAEGSNFKNMTNAITRSLEGGADSYDATASNIISGYELFKEPADYDISLLPLGYMPASTISTIIQTVVEARKDCVAFVSAPLNIGNSSTIATSIVAYRDTLPSSSYAVMDSGYKYQYDKYSDKFRWVPLAGDTAGLCANTDKIADPWFSPAGFNRGAVKNVTKLAFNPTVAQRDTLYKSGINPVVTFPGEGTVLYGDKTLLNKPSAFDRINVRRLFLVLEKAIQKASKYQLFEFNDEFTRAQFRAMVEPFLRDVQGRRGIVDFLVKCDTSNNTAEIIDRNEFVADIYIKPNRSINFITLNFIATKTGVKFDEIGA